MRTLLLVGFFICMGLGRVMAASDFDTLIPYPREIAAAGEVLELEGFQIVIGPSVQAKLGAEEINQRVVSLGEKALQIVKLGEVLPTGNLIILITVDAAPAVKLLPEPVRAAQKSQAQAYVIRTQKNEEGATHLWLVGNDKQGTLYAAVTARQLIQPTQGGELSLRPANITDWPDFKKRQLGYPMSEPRRGLWYALRQQEAQGKVELARETAKQWVERKKKHYDWMLRAKINWAWSHSFLKPSQFGDKTQIAQAAFKEIHQYGLARGIRTMMSATTAVGRFPQDKDNPDFKQVAYHSSHYRYFCWSRLSYHEKKAKRTAQIVANAGYKGFYLHAADGGGWRNPGLWNDRCDLCKKTYGDDHAKADAVVFGIYYREIRKLVPDCEFVTVVYPYSPEQLDADLVYADVSKEMGAGDGARKVAQAETRKLVEFVKRLDELLPKDILVTVRESERLPFDRMRAAWGKRNFHTYFEYAYWKGWQPYFTTTPLWTRSMYYPKHDDMLFGNLSGLGWREFTELLGAECAWNVNRPGAKDFSEAMWKDLGIRSAPPLQRKTFADRAARFWFGSQMGPLIAPAFAENISHSFIAFPEKILERDPVDDAPLIMQGQAEAAGRAVKSLDLARKLQEKKGILAGEDLGFMLNMYLMTHGAHITASHRARVMEVQRAIGRGERDQCQQILGLAQKELKQAALRWQSIYESVNKKELMYHYTRRRSNPHSYLSSLEFEEFEKEIAALAGSFEQKITARTMPAWFLRDLPRRRLSFVRSSDQMVIDGKLSEATWAAAQPASNFIREDRLQLEARETRARLAYDDKNIYVAFECSDADGRDEVSFSIARDKKVPSKGQATESRRWVVSEDGSQTATHFIASPYHATFGGKAVEAQIVIDKNWHSQVQIKTSKRSDIWIVEMAIPIAELGVKARSGSSCVVQLSRKAGAERVSYSFLDGGEAVDLQYFVLSEFSSQKNNLTPIQLGLEMQDLNFRHETIGSGAGTVIKGELSILSDRPLHRVKVSLTASDGLRVLGKMSYPVQERVPLIWRPEDKFMMRFAEEVPGVVVRFKVTADEGQWQFSRRFGSPRRMEKPPEELFTKGLGEGEALNFPMHFASPGPAETPWDEGTIEFWVKPKWTPLPRLTGPRGTIEHAFIHMGPIRPEHPTLANVNALALTYSASGHLSASLTSARYRHRAASANIRDWKAEQWHHVAMQWKLDDGGKTTVQLYVDGKLASTETYASPKAGAAEPLLPTKFRPPIQIGSMNTGVRPADAAMDELRISSRRRYDAEFKPAKRFSSDESTLALFHFDGNLEGEAASGDAINARHGAAQ
ncbi:MAG: hypothetical protein L3J39_01735 [Verrucomicrobiales bacterium]|nr:hypothetical protein [Verrucomicrobiales bacterium]